MSAKNELLKMIDERYHKFSKGQKKLADFIREDYDKAAFLTAAKMGGDMTDTRNFRKLWENW